jgi:hypothetical protein
VLRREQDTMTMEWKYLIEQMISEQFHDPKRLETRLNDRAADGWELVGIVDLDDETAGKIPHLIYKRLSGELNL